MLEIIKLNMINLNQTYTKFIISYDKGIRIYEIKDIEKDSINHSKKFIFIFLFKLKSQKNRKRRFYFTSTKRKY